MEHNEIQTAVGMMLGNQLAFLLLLYIRSSS